MDNGTQAVEAKPPVKISEADRLKAENLFLKAELLKSKGELLKMDLARVVEQLGSCQREIIALAEEFKERYGVDIIGQKLQLGPDGTILSQMKA